MASVAPWQPRGLKRSAEDALLDRDGDLEQHCQQHNIKRPLCVPASTASRDPAPVVAAVDIDAAVSMWQLREQRSLDTRGEPTPSHAHPAVTTHKRRVVLDWLSAVVTKFRMGRETFFMAAACMDRVLAAPPCTTSHDVAISDAQLPLMAAACLWTVAKFEEGSAPPASALCALLPQGAQPAQLCAMEVRVLRVLGFDLNTPTSFRFFGAYMKATGVSDMHANLLAIHMLELATLVGSHDDDQPVAHGDTAACAPLPTTTGAPVAAAIDPAPAAWEPVTPRGVRHPNSAAHETRASPLLGPLARPKLCSHASASQCASFAPLPSSPSAESPMTDAPPPLDSPQSCEGLRTPCPPFARPAVLVAPEHGPHVKRSARARTAARMLRVAGQREFVLLGRARASELAAASLVAASASVLSNVEPLLAALCRLARVGELRLLALAQALQALQAEMSICAQPAAMVVCYRAQAAWLESCLATHAHATPARMSAA